MTSSDTSRRRVAQSIRRAGILMGLLMAAMATACGSGAESPEVRVYNWSDYIDEGILEDFTGETGIRVVYDVFDSNDILETKLLAGGTGYDVVVPSASFMARQIQAGVFQKLDPAKLPNRIHLWDFILDRTSTLDPGNAYSVNYMWGTTGIGYNADVVEEIMPDAPVDSLAMVFDPAIISKFAERGVDVVEASEEMIPLALLYIGEDPTSHDSAVIEKAEAVLLAIRPYIRKIHSSEYINALANGDIALCIGFSGDVLQARDRADEAGNGLDIHFAIPKEGTQVWFDQLAVPKDAPHPDAAHQFIDYLMRPEVIARATDYVNYANGNKEAQALIDPEILADPAIYPTPEVLDRLFFVQPYEPDVQRQVTRIWTNFKAGAPQ